MPGTDIELPAGYVAHDFAASDLPPTEAEVAYGGDDE